MENKNIASTKLEKLMKGKETFYKTFFFNILSPNSKSSISLTLINDKNSDFSQNKSYSWNFSVNSSKKKKFTVSDQHSEILCYNNNSQIIINNLELQANGIQKKLENKTLIIKDNLFRSKTLQVSDTYSEDKKNDFDMKIDSDIINSNNISVNDSVDSVDKIINLKKNHKKSKFFLLNNIKYSEDDIDLNQKYQKNLIKKFSQENLETHKKNTFHFQETSSKILNHHQFSEFKLPNCLSENYKKKKI